MICRLLSMLNRVSLVQIFTLAAVRIMCIRMCTVLPRRDFFDVS